MHKHPWMDLLRIYVTPSLNGFLFGDIILKGTSNEFYLSFLLHNQLSGYNLVMNF